ncbi:hypothetical protein D3C87_836670 [compost metagenome]
MKNTLFFLLFFFQFIFVNSQQRGITEELIKDVFADNPEYLTLKLNPESFIPELSGDLKNSENYKYAMSEIQDGNFKKYFKSVRSINKISWKDYEFQKIKFDSIDYELQISSPIFIKNKKEVLIQVKTNYLNWYQVYKLKREKWELSYGFGEKSFAKNIL